MRLIEHKGYINWLFPTKSTGIHFNQRGHSLNNVKITILEKVRYNDENYRLEREKFHIRNFNTYYHGLNKMP